MFVKPIKVFAVASTVVLVLACRGSDVAEPGNPLAPDLPEWRLSSDPLVTIGVVEGDPNYQLFRASSAVRLPDETIVVANTGTSQLRFYDPRGRFIRSAGRRGGGPGEFRGLTSVHSLAWDTLTTFDGGLRRSYFDGQGRFLGSVNLEVPGETEYPESVWLYRRYWVDGVPPGEERVRFGRFLDRLPPPEIAPGYWYVRVDLEENIWVSDRMEPDGTRMHWTIFDSTGTARARATLPPRFEMLEIADSSVLGRWRDGLDIEFIQVLGLEKPAITVETLPAAPEPPDSVIPDMIALEEIVGGIRTVLRNTVIAQELHWADHQRYALHQRDLEWELPEGIWFDFILSGRRAYVGVAGHRDSPVICGIAVNAAPPGWLEGMVKCSQLEPG